MEYDGSYNDYKQYLFSTRPRGWLQEYHKLESMEAADNPGAVRCSRVKLVNKNTVIPSQVLLFLTKETLHGSKNQVYVLLKLLKKLTAAKVTSYQLKWAVEEKLKNTNVDSLSLGPGISL